MSRPNGSGHLAAGVSAKRPYARLIVMLLVLLAFSAIAWAEDGGATDNDVIRVAERMYCPVCENIPLDDCETIACVEWKEEIRAQLAAGRSDQEVIDSFVARFGDNVVGVPQDPLLRALAVLVPLLATALAIGLGAFTFRRFGAQRRLSLPPPPGSHEEGGGGIGERGGETSDEAYRQRLEADVRGRR
ncbi:MAG: cytochrome c-type biogenesis protein CcmH [Chloroflexi bacterium]|nr:cytochrome c-type biogenesis protein CcmH [Chloroflexota bacterium]